MSIPLSNPQTFSWIKSALSHSMLQAMESLTEVESSSDLAPLDSVSQNLHQIQASLKMMELDAASMFAGDLELLTERLSGAESDESTASSVAILKSGLDSLKTYLAGIENQIPQSPLVLVEKINKVRKLTGKNEISSYDLFDPPLELDSIIPPESICNFPEDKRKTLLFNLQKRFRQALLSWLNDKNEEQSLATMVEMSTHLQRMSGMEVRQQLWWVAAGFIESIQQHQIDVDADVKAQFAKLDNEMSRMGDHNTASTASSPPDELLRQMLFFIGRADTTSTNNDMTNRVEQIKEKLGLDQWFIVDARSPKQDDFAKLVQEIMGLVNSIDSDKIGQIENFTDLHFSGNLDEDQREKFFEQLDSLNKSANSWELGCLNKFVLAISDSIKQVDTSEEKILQTGADIKIASALLLFRDTLSNPASVSQQWEKSIVERTAELNHLLEFGHSEHAIETLGKQQADVELAHAKTAVSTEIAASLNKIEALMSSRNDPKVDNSQIQSVVGGYLDGIADWFEILEANHVMGLARNAGRKFVELSDIESRSSEQDHERMAFVVASIGVCAEQYSQVNHQPENIISRAQLMLESIGKMGNSPDIKHDQSADTLIDENDVDIDEGINVEISDDLQQVIDDLSDYELDNVESQLNSLDEIRRNIKSSTDKNVELIRLSLILKAIQGSKETHQNSCTSSLAELGGGLSQKLVEGAVKFDSDVVDFMGLISRQIRQIELEGEEFEQDELQEWKARYHALIELYEVDTEDEAHAIAALDDPELKSIFLDELSRHGSELEESITVLEEAISEIETGVDKDHQNKIMENVNNISLVMHTLSGNFKNLGLNRIGESLGHLESSVKFSGDDGAIDNDYLTQLRELLGVLNDTAPQIGEHQVVTSDLTERYATIAKVFKQMQLESTRNALLLDIDEIAATDDSEETNLDFSIEDLDENQDYHIATDDSSYEDSDSEEIQNLESMDDDSETLKVDRELEQIFIEESEFRLGSINNHLTEWRNNGFSDEILAGIRREFHTLKGSAGATGFEDISRLSHVVESLLEQGGRTSGSDYSSLLNLLEEMHDGLAAELGFIPETSDDHVNSLISMVELLLTEETKSQVDHKNSDVAGLISEQQESTQEKDMTASSWGPPDLATGLIEGDAVDSAIGALRIENKKLSDLLNFSGELGLTRTQLKNIVDGTRGELDLLRSSMKQIRDGLRDLEFEADSQMRSLPEHQDQDIGDESFDPLQLDRYSRLQAKAREISHQLDALSRVERQLSDHASDLDGTLIQQFHLGEQLQDGLMSARMVSINSYLPRLRQLVRETSRRLDKNVDFIIDGADIEVDRQVMDLMIPPFEHMIRNAIIHGIEAVEKRSESDKSLDGKIELIVIQQSSELLINFSDDGSGLDREKLSERAVEIGLVQNIDEISEEHLLQVISQPGYSTADSVSLGSGRGVGMDVVHQAVRSLGGSMALTSQPGEGVSFQFRLPVTMAISQALLVKVGIYRFAILTRTIDRVMRVWENELKADEGQKLVEIGDQTVPVISLAEQLGEESLSTDEVYISLVLIRLADRILAFEVDQFQETVEIVTKTPGKQLTSIDGVVGVTILADTSIVLILDLGQFIDRVIHHRELSTFDSNPSKDEQVVSNLDVSSILHRVLVVDDSLVVRKVMQRDIEGIGLDVVLAVDGMDALDVLTEEQVDVALIDLEMPKLNGYEIIVKLREDPAFENLPIIVITSRSGELHRERAIGLGADEYITKPYDIEELHEMMRSVVLRKVVKH